MKWITISLTTLLLTISLAYADDPASVAAGAQQYDWQSCINEKADACINDCATSEDINCNDKCKDLAKDKCISEGISQ